MEYRTDGYRLDERWQVEQNEGVRSRAMMQAPSTAP